MVPRIIFCAFLGPTMLLVSCRNDPTSKIHERVKLLIQTQKYNEALQLTDEELKKNPEDVLLLKDRLLLLLGSDSSEARSALVQTQKALDEAGEGKEFLISQADRESSVIRMQIAWLLGETGKDEVINTLRELGDDKNEDVRAEAVQALGKINSSAAKYFLLVRLRDGYWRVRAEAAEALASLGNPDVTPQLFRNANDSDDYTRGEVLDAILALADESQVTIYQKNLLSEVPSFQLAAALALGKLGKPEATPVLLEWLKNKKSSERPRIASSLQNWGSDSISIPLEKILSHESNPEVKASLLEWFKSRTDLRSREIVNKYQ